MIHITCALKCEAKPLLQFFNLQHDSRSGLFPVYVSKDRELSVTITGTGKLAAAAATMYTHGLFANENSDIWLNIGVAGHLNYPVGEAFLANRIEDADSGEVWYPQIVCDTELSSAGLLSLSRPSTDYSDNMYDMEASGFYSVVSRFATAELCHSLKIISDNQAQPADELSERVVAEWIAAKKHLVADFLTALSKLAKEICYSPPAALPEFLQHWHFSRYEQRQLEHLLRRWQLLLPKCKPLNDEIMRLRRVKDVLSFLRKRLDATSISYV